MDPGLFCILRSALRRLCCLLPSQALPLLRQLNSCARREAVGSCCHPWHYAALCCCSEKCVHNFCQPFEEALIRQGWGPALLGDGEAQSSRGTLSCSLRGPFCCSYTVTKSLPVPGNVQPCVWCVGLPSALQGRDFRQCQPENTGQDLDLKIPFLCCLYIPEKK